MTDRAYQVPLHERLASVPENARLVIDDPDGMGTRYIPVGKMCHEAAAALREQARTPKMQVIDEMREVPWEQFYPDMGKPVMAEYKHVEYGYHRDANGGIRLGVIEPNRCQKKGACERGTDGYCARCHEEMYP